LFVITPIIWSCTVHCFTRSPRWGTGYERDLKRERERERKKKKKKS